MLSEVEKGSTDIGSVGTNAGVLPPPVTKLSRQTVLMTAKSELAFPTGAIMSSSHPCRLRKPISGYLAVSEPHF